jgi:hypothetical protein
MIANGSTLLLFFCVVFQDMGKAFYTGWKTSDTRRWKNWDELGLYRVQETKILFPIWPSS